ncbi:DUF4893 domain-containing protein [Parasphingorhabdus cellanae]|uniref:DUF4893 domain-containing protein n=1 Tax=Parasphingorhabdus cellanae TaxID=2806553 RepID=A0ABX7T9B0_9SPHN|nr:DUF4893 domain-containing protein [Parasphingorhabdus cellanae]QTD56638.1 DUF4893 domain-containing protein [Parasphingorhabdus cellanae]
MIRSVFSIVLILASIFLAAVGFSPVVAAEEKAKPPSQWRTLVTAADEKRLDDWQKALRLGRESAVQRGEADKISERDPLFQESAALPNSNIPAGLYACSISKLAGYAAGGLPYIAYPAFRCRVTVDAGRRHFTKLTGSQRTIGWLYEAGTHHSIYLGSLIYGYEDKLIAYGNSAERDQAAVVQRIGPERWRMVFPYPYYESTVDVMELTPITE